MSDTRIAGLQGRRVWDSRGRPTVEAEVRLIGGDSLVAVSMASLHAAANAAGLPLYAHLLGGRAEAVLPLPEIQIFGGGAHAGRRVDIQDFMIVAPQARSFDQALEWTAEVYR